jgi:hypothetical protein
MPDREAVVTSVEREQSLNPANIEQPEPILRGPRMPAGRGQEPPGSLRSPPRQRRLGGPRKDKPQEALIVGPSGGLDCPPGMRLRAIEVAELPLYEAKIVLHLCFAVGTALGPVRLERAVVQAKRQAHLAAQVRNRSEVGRSLGGQLMLLPLSSKAEGQFIRGLSSIEPAEFEGDRTPKVGQGEGLACPEGGDPNEFLGPPLGET